MKMIFTLNLYSKYSPDNKKWIFVSEGFWKRCDQTSWWYDCAGHTQTKHLNFLHTKRFKLCTKFAGKMVLMLRWPQLSAQSRISPNSQQSVGYNLPETWYKLMNFSPVFIFLWCLSRGRWELNAYKCNGAWWLLHVYICISYVWVAKCRSFGKVHPFGGRHFESNLGYLSYLE